MPDTINVELKQDFSDCSPSKVTLTSLSCFSTETNFGSDDARLEIISDSMPQQTLRREMNDGDTWALNIDVALDSSATINLWDEDSFDDDDHLGAVTIRANQLTGCGAFTNDGAHYNLCWTKVRSFHECRDEKLKLQKVVKPEKGMQEAALLQEETFGALPVQVKPSKVTHSAHAFFSKLLVLKESVVLEAQAFLSVSLEQVYRNFYSVGETQRFVLALEESERRAVLRAYEAHLLHVVRPQLMEMQQGVPVPSIELEAAKISASNAELRFNQAKLEHKEQQGLLAQTVSQKSLPMQVLDLWVVVYQNFGLIKFICTDIIPGCVEAISLVNNTSLVQQASSNSVGNALVSHATEIGCLQWAASNAILASRETPAIREVRAFDMIRYASIPVLNYVETSFQSCATSVLLHGTIGAIAAWPFGYPGILINGVLKMSIAGLRCVTHGDINQNLGYTAIAGVTVSAVVWKLGAATLGGSVMAGLVAADVVKSVHDVSKLVISLWDEKHEEVQSDCIISQKEASVEQQLAGDYSLFSS